MAANEQINTINKINCGDWYGVTGETKQYLKYFERYTKLSFD